MRGPEARAACNAYRRRSKAFLSGSPRWQSSGGSWMAGAAGQSDAGFLRKATVTGVATAWPLTWKRKNPDDRCSGNLLAWNGQEESHQVLWVGVGSSGGHVPGRNQSCRVDRLPITENAGTVMTKRAAPVCSIVLLPRYTLAARMFPAQCRVGTASGLVPAHVPSAACKSPRKQQKM